MTQDKGIFLAFEGGEGAGKTTVVNALADSLTAKGIEVVKTREPGVTALGEEIRALLLLNQAGHTIGAKAELLLFLTSRAQNIEEVIQPALERGAWVLCDRFNDSTIAYQGWARDLGLEEVERLCSWVCGETLPDMTFFLSIDPGLGLKRTRKAAALDRIESESMQFHARVQEGFNRIASIHPEHFTFVDASKTQAEVLNDVWKAITVKFGLQ